MRAGAERGGIGAGVVAAPGRVEHRGGTRRDAAVEALDRQPPEPARRPSGNVGVRHGCSLLGGRGSWLHSSGGGAVSDLEVGAAAQRGEGGVVAQGGGVV